MTRDTFKAKCVPESSIDEAERQTKEVERLNSLLAEAESLAQVRLRNQEAMAERLAYANEQRDALQSRLDAVAGLADRWEDRSKAEYSFKNTQLKNCANELRAALGGESPGNDEELK